MDVGGLGEWGRCRRLCYPAPEVRDPLGPAQGLAGEGVQIHPSPYPSTCCRWGGHFWVGTVHHLESRLSLSKLIRISRRIGRMVRLRVQSPPPPPHPPDQLKQRCYTAICWESSVLLLFTIITMSPWWSLCRYPVFIACQVEFS